MFNEIPVKKVTEIDPRTLVEKSYEEHKRVSQLPEGHREKLKHLSPIKKASIGMMPKATAACIAQMVDPRKAYQSGRTPEPLTNFGAATSSRRFWVKSFSDMIANASGQASVIASSFSGVANDFQWGRVASTPVYTGLPATAYPGVATSGAANVLSNSPFSSAQLKECDVMLLACGVYLKDVGPAYTAQGSCAVATNPALDKQLTVATYTIDNIRSYAPGCVEVGTCNHSNDIIYDSDGWIRSVWTPQQWGPSMHWDHDSTGDDINPSYYGGVPVNGEVLSSSMVPVWDMAIGFLGLEAGRKYRVEFYAAYDVRGFVESVPQLISNKKVVGPFHEQMIKHFLDLTKGVANSGLGKAAKTAHGVLGTVANFINDLPIGPGAALRGLKWIGNELMSGNPLSAGMNLPLAMAQKAIAPSSGMRMSRMYDSAAAARGEMPLIEEIFENSFMDAALGVGEEALPLLFLA